MSRTVVRLLPLLVATATTCAWGASGNSADPALNKLIATKTADAQAAAALLKQFGEENDTNSYHLARRAAELAPERHDLAWLAVRMCNRAADCNPEAAEQHLRQVDPGNGILSIRKLVHALAVEDADGIDSALTALADSQYLYVYFDPLVASTATALVNAKPQGGGQPTRKEVATAAITMIGVIAASVLPSLKPLEVACKGTGLENAGRLERCRRAARTLADHSDTFITEGLGLSLEQHLWPLDSPEGQAITARRRVLQYRLEQYGRLNVSSPELTKFPLDYLNVVRAHEREQDAALVYFEKEKISVNPPAGWTPTMLPRVP